MTKILIPVAAGLLAVSAAGAWAQGGYTTDGGATARTAVQRTDTRANLPGWTGRTFVPGSNSSIADTATSTRRQQEAPYGRGR